MKTEPNTEDSIRELMGFKAFKLRWKLGIAEYTADSFFYEEPYNKPRQRRRVMWRIYRSRIGEWSIGLTIIANGVSTGKHVVMGNTSSFKRAKEMVQKAIIVLGHQAI